MYNFEVLSKWAQEKPNELAFADGVIEVSFKRFNSTVRKTATFLSQQGISRGDFVCTVLDPYDSWVFTLALQLLGTKTISKNTITPFDLDKIPRRMIAYQPHPQLSQSETIILTPDVFSRIDQSAELVRAPGYKNPTDVTRLFSTSGTTGHSKEISVTIEELARFTDQVSSYEVVGEDDVLSLYPFAARQSYRRALKCLTQGKPYFACGSLSPQLPELVKKYPIRTLMGSSVQILSFLDAQLNTASEFPNLKTIILGGSTPTKEIVARIKSQLGCKIYDAYGSSEGSYVAMRELPEEFSDGMIINPDVSLQIVDEMDEEVRTGEIGRIRYTRQGIAQSYHQNAEASLEFFKDGYFYPGDLGFINSQGKLELSGRSSEVINLGGVKINPEKVDEVVRNQLGVLDCASFSVVGSSGINELAIAIVVNGDFDDENFARMCEVKFGMKPALIAKVDVIPRNENGKVLRGDLTKLFSNGSPIN